MTGAYLQFTELFAKLSPYELSHFTETLLCKIEDCFEGKLVNKTKHELTEHELKYAVIHTMRDASLLAQKRTISQEQLKLRQKKSEVYSVRHVNRAA